MDEAPPVGRAQPDPKARMQVLRLAVAPLVFLAHFGAVYGWAGLACSFGWIQPVLGPVTLLAAGVIVLTAAALLLVWIVRAPPPQQARLDEAEDADHGQPAYDPGERGHFLATATRMAAWLAVAGMLAVAAMVLLVPDCIAAP